MLTDYLDGIKGMKKGFAILTGIMVLCFLTGMAQKPPLVGGPAPHFQLNTLNGRPAKISDFQGNVVLLTFWATWCKPCKKEMPEIQAAYETLKDEGFVVLALNFGEKGQVAEKLVREMNLTFTVLLDEEVEVAERHQVVSLPVSFFIDAQGVIRKKVVGGTLTQEEITQIFYQILNKTGR